MYYFIVTPKNEIHCFNSEKNEFIAKAESLFIRSEQSDFWTSIKINDVLYDINIFRQSDDEESKFLLSLYNLKLEGEEYFIDTESYNTYQVKVYKELF